MRTRFNRDLHPPVLLRSVGCLLLSYLACTATQENEELNSHAAKARNLTWIQLVQDPVLVSCKRENRPFNFHTSKELAD
jgi:hypothetical protein